MVPILYGYKEHEPSEASRFLALVDRNGEVFEALRFGTRSDGLLLSWVLGEDFCIWVVGWDCQLVSGSLRRSLYLAWH